MSSEILIDIVQFIVLRLTGISITRPDSLSLLITATGLYPYVFCHKHFLFFRFA